MPQPLIFYILLNLFLIEVSIIKLPIWTTIPPIKLSSIFDFNLIERLMLVEISFSISETVSSSIFLTILDFQISHLVLRISILEIHLLFCSKKNTLFLTISIKKSFLLFYLFSIK